MTMPDELAFILKKSVGIPDRYQLRPILQKFHSIFGPVMWVRAADRGRPELVLPGISRISC